MNDKEEIREFIRKSYAEVALKGSEGGCCGSSCGCSCGDNVLDIIKTWAPGKKVEEFVASYIIEADKMKDSRKNAPCCGPSSFNQQKCC